MMYLVYTFVWLLCGTLYPAYASFKAVKSKNAKNYVRWMMYWIVYAMFVASESLLDPLLIFWFPFYFEFKTIFLLYLVSSSTRGSSMIYKTWVHPALTYNEGEIDLAIEKLKMKSLETVKVWVKAGVQKVGIFVSKTALSSGGGLVQQLQRSYSMMDLTDLGLGGAEGGTDFEDRNTQDAKTRHLVSRMKHYKSEECLRDPHYSSLRRWRPPDMMMSTNSISSGYSTDSLLPVIDNTEDQFDENMQFSRYEAIELRAKEILMRDTQMEPMMVTRQKTRRKLQENLHSK